jgi:hypothetical protein
MAYRGGGVPYIYLTVCISMLVKHNTKTAPAAAAWQCEMPLCN